jgi:ribosome-associated toxin RatA of RatAB toxin-antitoxin module
MQYKLVKKRLTCALFRGVAAARLGAKARGRVHLGALVAAAVAAVMPAIAQPLTPEQLTRLKAGEALVSVEDDQGEADGRIEAAIEIAAGPHRVWQVMTDCARAPRFVAGLKSCRVLQHGPADAWDIREHRSQWLSILPETISVFRSDYVVDKEIRFERVSGTLRFLKGAWRLEPLAGGARTRLFYSVRVGISAPVPGFMIRSALEADVPKLLYALRSEAVQAGP